MDDFDFDKLQKEEEHKINKGLEIARKNGINLSFFKKEISKYLDGKNNEDQWTFDYESYLFSIIQFFETPIEWGKTYYTGRWKQPPINR